MSERVPLGGRGEYAKTKSPSTHDRDAVEGGFTSDFPADKITHRHMTPKGEDDQEGQRQYRSPGDASGKRNGPALDRAIPRHGPYGDRASRFGTTGSGAVYGTEKERPNRMGDDFDRDSLGPIGKSG